MLNSYAFKNFQSFRDQAHVSFLLNSKSPVRAWTSVSPSGQRFSKVLAIFGANGAGKTALLKCLAFTEWFAARSFSTAEPESLIPLTQHFSSRGEPTEIELEVEDKVGDLWRYVLIATPNRVIHESLYKKKERFGYVFLRDWDEATEAYAIKQQGFGFATAEARKVRPNASLISTAAQYGVEVAQRLLEELRLVSNVSVVGRLNISSKDLLQASQLFGMFPPLAQQMVGLLVKWDLGLTGVDIRQVDVAGTDGKTVKQWTPFGVHQSKDGESHSLIFQQESSGTQSAFILLSRMLAILSSGGVLAIDELENDLHPHMVEPVLDLFANPETNPHDAQLIFTCHTPEVLDILHKSQVLFVEKDECESIVFRGDEIHGLRSDDNLRTKYMSGALGAVPRV